MDITMGPALELLSFLLPFTLRYLPVLTRSNTLLRPFTRSLWLVSRFGQGWNELHQDRTDGRYTSLQERDGYPPIHPRKTCLQAKLQRDGNALSLRMQCLLPVFHFRLPLSIWSYPLDVWVWVGLIPRSHQVPSHQPSSTSSCKWLSPTKKPMLYLKKFFGCILKRGYSLFERTVTARTKSIDGRKQARTTPLWPHSIYSQSPIHLSFSLFLLLRHKQVPKICGFLLWLLSVTD